MPQEDLGGVPDGGTLRRIDGGLEIVRRRKHESISLDDLTADEVAIRTGRVFGSKFDDFWTLARLVDWIESVVGEAGWQREPGLSREMVHRFDIAVGISEGRVVYSVKVVNPDGMYVHAYPVEG